MAIFQRNLTKGFYPANAQGAVFRTPAHSMPSSNQDLMAKMEQVYLCSAMFWAAVQQIVKPARSCRLKVEKKKGHDWVEEPKHQISSWWKMGINAEMNGKIWIEAMVTHLAVYGIFRNEWTHAGMQSPDARDVDGKAILTSGLNEAPWLTPVVPYVLVPDIRKEVTNKTNYGGARIEMPKPTMPMITNAHGRLFRYVHASSEDMQTGYPVETSDVFIAKNYNPERGYIGISPLKLISDVLGMGDALIKHSYTYLKNNAVPSGIITYAGDSTKYQVPELSANEKKQVENAYLQLFGLDGERTNSPVMLPKGADFKTLSPELDKLLPSELWDIVQGIVHEVLGTSPTESLVGLRHGNNRASARAHQTSVWRYTVEPLMDFTAGNLANFLFKKFAGDDARRFEQEEIRIVWDYSAVPAYREIQEVHSKTVLDATYKGIAQINEGRKALGLPEDPELTGKYLSQNIAAVDVPANQDPLQNGDPQAAPAKNGTANALPVAKQNGVVKK